MESDRFKVLIADDEYWTREKICRMVDWESYHLQLLAPAVDGEDVLQKIEQNRPHILITDINMPYLNGIDLLKILQENYPDIITFVISGYDDFEYVREAFLSGSIHYLVKPVSKIDLVNALSKALERISQRMDQELKLLKAASLIQDREFSQLLEREAAPFTPSITVNSNLDFAGSTLILIKVHNMSRVIPDYHYDMNLVSWSLKKQIKEAFHHQGSFVFNHIYRANEFIVVTDQDSREISRIADRLRIDFSAATGSPVSVVLSSHSYSMDSLRQAYIQTISLLMTRPFGKNSMVIAADRSSGEAEIVNRFSDRQMNELSVLLKRRNEKAIRRLVQEDIGLSACERTGWKYLEVRQTVKRILNQIFEFVFASAGPKESSSFEQMIEMVDKAIELLDGDYLRELLDDCLDGIFAAEPEETYDSIRTVVRQVVGYIRENYYENLTLSSLAEKFCVESSYLSRSFKKETGDNLMLFIAKEKVARAKEMIASRDISLTEIAYLTGYDDYTYFNKVFRRLEGISPREYKQAAEKKAEDGR